MKISELMRDRRTVIIPVGDDDVAITYRPAGLTPETEENLTKYANDQRGGAALVAFLADCLVEWDITDDSGKPLPINTKTLSKLPIVFLGQVVSAISEDMRPNPPSAVTYGAGSKQTDS